MLRFSWLLRADHEAEAGQSAWQLQAFSAEPIAEAEPDLWDSGKITGSDTQAHYKGVPLDPGKSLYWRVRVWDQNDEESAWSDWARIADVGLQPEHWTGRWICHPTEPAADPDAMAFEPGVDRWIWPTPPPAKYPEEWKLWSTFEIGDVKEVTKAEVLVSVDQSFRLWLNGKAAAESDDKIFSWCRPVTASLEQLLQAGENQIVLSVSNFYLSKPGACLQLRLRYRDGSERKIRTNTHWMCQTWDGDPGVREVLDSGTPAYEVAVMGEMPWRTPKTSVEPLPVVAFGKKIDAEKPVRRASVRLTALGNVAVAVDGELEANIPRLWPGWTDYTRRVGYQRFVLQRIVGTGSFDVQLLLAGGWYAGYLGWERGKGYYGNLPAVLAEVVLEYEDGSLDVIGTDAEWSVSPDIRVEADILMGERWVPDAADPDMPETATATLWTGPVPEVVPAEWEPVRVKEVVPLGQAWEHQGDWMLDFGRNIAGAVRLQVPPQAKVELGHAELLDSEGGLYTENLRMARAVDQYATGAEPVTAEPLFSYHGFRFVRVKGLPASQEPRAEAFTLGSDLARTGRFNCDDPTLQSLYDTYLRSSESNLVDISTDCPQRDERLGWTGDGSILSEAHCRTYGMRNFYRKWLTDLFSAQRPDGSLPDIAPMVPFGSGIVGWNNAAWSDAAVLVSHRCMEAYGFEDELRTFWPRLERYADSLWNDSEAGYRPPKGHGDWLSIGDRTPTDLIATVFHIGVSDSMAAMAKQLGIDASLYEERAFVTRESFRQRFGGEIKQFSQSACVLCLHFNAMPLWRNPISQRLVEDLEDRDYRMTTGFLGTAHLPMVLTQIGRPDLAMNLLRSRRFPSWSFMLDFGATTFWEHWDSFHPARGFKDPLMNSFNHASLGGFSHWFYRVPGWLDGWDLRQRVFKLKAHLLPGMTSARLEQRTDIGTITVDWAIRDRHLHGNVRVPPNTTAELIPPTKDIGARDISRLGPGKHQITWDLRPLRFDFNL